MFGYRQTYGYFLKQGSPAFMPEISVAPGTISAGMVSLTYAVPSVDKESIKVAPGAIVVDLFVPET